MELIKELPNDLLLHIKSYIPQRILLTLSKEKYLIYQNFIKFIVGQRQDSYIRYILRNDLHFIFSFRIHEFGEYWSKINKEKYKEYIFDTKLLLYKHYTIENNANKCRELIDTYTNDNMNIKRHKKCKLVKTIWSN